MGLFDTLVFRKEFICDKCKAKIKNTQTKQFDNTLSTYTEGDFVYGANIITGVIKENLYCDNCKNFDQNIYIAIWHSLYIGTFHNYEDAEARINSVEKTDLLDYILFQQKRFVKSVRAHNTFYSLIREFSEYCNNKDQYQKEHHFHFAAHDFKDYIKKTDDEKEILKNILEDFQKVPDLPDDIIF